MAVSSGRRTVGAAGWLGTLVAILTIAALVLAWYLLLRDRRASAK